MRIAKTLDEFFDSSEATRLLVKNLETNLEVFGDTMDQECKEDLMRVNLIMIRQCLQDFGVE